MRKRSLTLVIIISISMLLTTACSTQSAFGPDDKAIVSDIQSKLFQDSVLKTRDIKVDANKGTVVLTGTVNTELEKSAAERLASQASGVKQVQNQLMVTSSTAAEVAPPVTETGTAEQPTARAPDRARERAKQRAQRAAALRDRRDAETRSASVLATEEKNTAANAPVASAAPAPAASAPAPPPPAPLPPQPIRVTIPAGTMITVRMIDGVDSSRDRAGQEFSATIDSPIVVDDRVVLPRGADARVRLVNARNAGHMTGRSELQLQLSGISVAGTNYDTDSTTYSQLGASRGKRTAETVGGGAVLGGLIGAIAGHGKGAVIGSVIGAGAGTAVEAGTKAPPMRVPSETKVDFTLKSPINITLPPHTSRANASE